MRFKLTSIIRSLCVVFGICVLVSGFAGAPSALANASRWQLSASSAPTDLPAGGEGQIAVAATNLGDASVKASTDPVTVIDKLPPNVTATAILAFPLTYVGYLSHFGGMKCSIPSASLVSCTSTGMEVLPPFETLEVRVAVKVAEGAKSGEENEATIAGGETPSATVRQPLTVGTETPFGISDYKLVSENEDGSPDTQAGSHPFQFTATLGFNQTLEASPKFTVKLPTTPELVKNLQSDLPPGLIGNPTAVPQCTDLEFETLKPENVNLCPAETALGVASVTLKEPNNQGFATIPVPLFNLTPAQGEPARFGFEALGVPVIFDTSVRTGRDYGVVVTIKNTPQVATIASSRVTFWGVPGDPRHNQSRGWSCLDWGVGGTCAAPEQRRPPPFLTLPTSCTGPLRTSVEADSWAHPGTFVRPQPPEYTFQSSAGEAIGMDSCSELPFSPSIQVTPEQQTASTPTGLTVGVHLPQDTTLAANGLAESALKDTTVTLPEGMQVSPAAADGLLACSIAEVGFEGFDGSTQTNLFSPGPVSCPDASKVGTVKIKTPLLANPLEGAVYLAAQNVNPFSSLLALYMVAEDPSSGVRVKLAGKVSPDPTTGQLTSTFENTPQLPFEDLTLKFFGGPRASLTTPQYCGLYTTAASFTPWSGEAPVNKSSSFEIATGPNGSSCVSPPPFAPSLTAGSASLQAGAFTPFTETMSREDGNQNLTGITLHTPPGLLGMLSSTTRCPEPQASQGTCGPDSLIGHTVVNVGLGTDPFAISGGQVFITGPYKGAPFGLSIAEPAKAGPFDLGTGPCDCVVVRAKIEIDRHTSALTVVSDPLPTILQGIPTQIKHVTATIDRPDFTFNPTNCSQQAITAVLSGEQGANAAASVPFQVANCATLPFKPSFSVSTQGKTSKANGASLDVKVAEKPGEANIHKVDTQLPLALPSRLTTIQKACPEAQFAANPAGCPVGSNVGTAVAHTPVLNAPLTGPAYLVSHGGAAFPDLDIVLQGEGITIDLTGHTDIKKGITSSHFETVPDAPISTFELNLPEGPHSALAAVGKLCEKSLVMPTTITGQNGAQLKQSTKIAVTGCRAVTISKRRLSGKNVVLSFILTAKGAVTVKGKGLKGYRKTLGAGSHQIKVGLSKVGLLMRRHHRKIKIKVALKSGATVSGATTTVKL
jgi:hypothetical protein